MGDNRINFIGLLWRSSNNTFLELKPVHVWPILSIQKVLGMAFMETQGKKHPFVLGIGEAFPKRVCLSEDSWKKSKWPPVEIQLLPKKFLQTPRESDSSSLWPPTGFCFHTPRTAISHLNFCYSHWCICFICPMKLKAPWRQALASPPLSILQSLAHCLPHM